LIYDRYILGLSVCGEAFNYGFNKSREVYLVANIELKQQKVNEITEKIKKSQAVILTSYKGITVEEDTQLRKQLREAGVEYKVIKNTLTSRAAKEAGFEQMDEYLKGPVSVAFGYDDPTAPARILADFAKNHDSIELKAGIVQGKFFDSAKINELSKIPPKEVLIAKLLGSLKSPLSKFVYVVNAIKEKKEQEANA
jgi:large subunit ribosomal protein L10